MFSSPDKIYYFQSWITARARETVALGRELLGGNGILADFLVAKVSFLYLYSNGILADFLVFLFHKKEYTYWITIDKLVVHLVF